MKSAEWRFQVLREGLTIRGIEYRPEGEDLPIAIRHGFNKKEDEQAFQDIQAFFGEVIKMVAPALKRVGAVFLDAKIDRSPARWYTEEKGGGVLLSDFFPVWGKLTLKQQTVLNESAKKQFAPKRTVIHNGELDCAGLVLVKSGQLRAYILSEEGREITVYRLFEGDVCLFSASCIMRSIQFDITIEAEKDTDLFVIPSEVYKGVMEASAPLSNFTTEVMASRFSEVMWLLENTLWKSFDKRLAAFLLDESAIEGTDSLKITHETIGNHLGNPREVVTRMLRYFQSEGLVKLSRGTVELTDRKGLEKLQNQ